MGARLDSALAVLNGTIGDYLERTDNGLATRMECVHRGRPVVITRDALARVHPEPTPRVVLLVHGLMCTEAVWRFRDPADGDHARDYGSLLAGDLGYTPFYLRYNSGRAIPDNGAALAGLLDALVDAAPVAMDELLLIGHSLGGLVMRSACEAARAGGHRWLSLLRRVIVIDTPHLGSPLERVGRLTTGLLRAVGDPSARLAAEIGDLRSDGIKDLGDADLRHEDRARRRSRPRPAGWRHPVPFPAGIAHCVVAGTASSRRPLARAMGELLVPLSSATAQYQREEPARVRIFAGIGHLELARHPEVYAQIRAWCEEPR